MAKLISIHRYFVICRFFIINLSILSTHRYYIVSFHFVCLFLLRSHALKSCQPVSVLSVVSITGAHKSKPRTRRFTENSYFSFLHTNLKKRYDNFSLKGVAGHSDSLLPTLLIYSHISSILQKYDSHRSHPIFH